MPTRPRRRSSSRASRATTAPPPTSTGSRARSAASAARLAAALRDAGFDVTTKIGGHGVVAVLKNGPGPTVLLRTDLLNVTPLNDPATAIVVGMDTSNVDTVMIAGHVLKRRGRILHVDWPAVRAGLIERLADQ